MADAEFKSIPVEHMPLDGDVPVTLDGVIQQLRNHRDTHTDWAGWFEANPTDPRQVEQFGSAAFHRRVERHYTKMIDFLESLRPVVHQPAQ